MHEREIRLGGFVRESVVDGIGVRFALFGSGCIHQCPNCHNQDLWDRNFGELFSIRYLIREIQHSRMIDGITCSGGDPFEQAEVFGLLCTEVKKMGLNVWTYTGYTYEYIMDNLENNKGWKELINNTDVLVDGPFVEGEKSLELAFRGSKNQRLIDVKQSLLQGEVVTLDLDK